MFPEDWENGVYDSKKAAGRSHLEPFHFDALRMLEESVLEKRDCICLFDYSRKNPLNKNARLTML